MNMAATPPEDARSLDRYAVALANFQRMNEELAVAHDNMDQLRADLHREEDRVSMLIEERDRYRYENIRLRAWLTELSTQMATVHLLTVKATEIVQSIEELHSRETPRTEVLDQLDRESGIEALDRLDRFVNGNGAVA